MNTDILLPVPQFHPTAIRWSRRLDLRSRRWMKSAFAIFALLLPLITFSPSSVALAIVAAGLALVGLGSEQN